MNETEKKNYIVYENCLRIVYEFMNCKLFIKITKLFMLYSKNNKLDIFSDCIKKDPFISQYNQQKTLLQFLWRIASIFFSILIVELKVNIAFYFFCKCTLLHMTKIDAN